MSVQIIRGNALDLPLADDSVDLVVTSPPYFGLRSYQDGGEHYDGQIGSEATPAEFVDALIAATREMVRVTRPSGSIWVNLGDAYFSGKGAPGRTTIDAKSPARTARRAGGNALDGPSFGVQRKSLVGIPWRYALRCIDDLGLILRAEVIWSKPNGLPESVTDRVRRSHEQWFHFVQRPRYYSAVDEIREAHQFPNQTRTNVGRGAMPVPNNTAMIRADHPVIGNNPLGKLPGSVWTVPTQPLTVPAHLGVDHFAAFPMAWPRRIVSGWSPRGVCEACGEGRRPVAEATGRTVASSGSVLLGGDGVRYAGRSDSHAPIRTATGWSLPKAERVLTGGEACACPDTIAPTRPGVILDPFGGTGTTALVAHALGRHGISVDMSADYCRLAEWRTTDAGQIAAAMQVEKPAPVMDGQLDIFGEAV